MLSQEQALHTKVDQARAAYEAAKDAVWPLYDTMMAAYQELGAFYEKDKEDFENHPLWQTLDPQVDYVTEKRLLAERA